MIRTHAQPLKSYFCPVLAAATSLLELISERVWPKFAKIFKKRLWIEIYLDQFLKKYLGNLYGAHTPAR